LYSRRTEAWLTGRGGRRNTELHPAARLQVFWPPFWVHEAKHSMARTKCGRKRGSRRLEFQSYIFRVETSEVSYSLSIDRKGVTEGPYWEHLEMSVRGTIVSPENMQGRQGTLTFLADRRITRDLDNPIESRSQPIAVGTLTIWGGTTSYLGSLPHDALWHLLGLLTRGEIQMLALHGETLYRGSAKILNVHFEREIDPKDW
jgi:hypothetical protein